MSAALTPCWLCPTTEVAALPLLCIVGSNSEHCHHDSDAAIFINFRPKVTPTVLPFSVLGQGDKTTTQLQCSFGAASSH